MSKSISSATAKLERTSDYDLFEVHEYNREEKKLAALEESMRKYGFIPGCAIHVEPTSNGKLKIIRGHHRVYTAQKLGLPVWYIVDRTKSGATIFELEGSSHQSWKANDFISAYAKAGNQNYIFLQHFCKTYGVNVGVAASLCRGRNMSAPSKLIASGNFVADDQENAFRVINLVDAMADCGIDFAKQSAFILAVNACFLIPEFDPEVLKGRAKMYPAMMLRRANRNDYLDEIEKLYNHGAREKRIVGLKAKVLEALRERNIKFNPGLKKKTKNETGLFGANELYVRK